MKHKIRVKYVLPNHGVISYLFILSVIVLTSNTATAIGTEIIGIGSTMMDADSTTTLQINLANAVDIAGLSLDINYDPKVIEIMGVSANNDAVLGSVITQNIDNSEGKVSIVLTNITTINTISSIPLINIAIHAMDVPGGETTLTLQNVEVTDINFSAIAPETIIDGHIIINCENTSFVEQIDTESMESSVNDGNMSLFEQIDTESEGVVNGEITQSVSVMDNTTAVENDQVDLPMPLSSETDQTSTSGFGFTLTVSTLFFITIINKIK